MFLTQVCYLLFNESAAVNVIEIFLFRLVLSQILHYIVLNLSFHVVFC